ncbi:N-acetylmuramoyl-L-alanine amidase [Gordonia alkaliphila]|uniref:N-acetylmuramoyl-L-alanine amidase n=1 Tax=Gordonia alkaliphila TaxID=1053547 RepID=A0ABP8ZK38_9ACTN
MADPIWLPEVLRAAGLPVTVMSGAMNRGHGDFGTIWGVMAHHTGAPATSTPGPGWIANHPQLGLASQLYLSRDGKFTVCGVGIAWHAGQGSYPGIPTNNANQVTIGIEAENSGTEGWSKPQYGAYVTGVAAILNKLGRDSSRVIGHKEWAGRTQGKWDPGGMDMSAFRRDVAAEQKRLKGGDAPPKPVENKIDVEAKVAAAWIGKRLFEGERDAKNGGKYVDFANGSIYWHPEVMRANSNAIAVPSNVYETWKAHDYERGFLGYPVKRHTVVKGVGDIQAFQGGVVYRKYGKPGYPVRGVIGQRWAAEGFESGPLGWPTSDERDNGTGGRVQDFEGGELSWDPSGAVKVVSK